MGVPSHSQGEPEVVVHEYDCASYYDTFEGDITISSIVGYGGEISAARFPTSG